jgi:hypothetical protein
MFYAALQGNQTLFEARDPRQKMLSLQNSSRLSRSTFSNLEMINKRAVQSATLEEFTAQ